MKTKLKTVFENVENAMVEFIDTIIARTKDNPLVIFKFNKKYEFVTPDGKLIEDHYLGMIRGVYKVNPSYYKEGYVDRIMGNDVRLYMYEDDDYCHISLHELPYESLVKIFNKLMEREN